MSEEGKLPPRPQNIRRGPRLQQEGREAGAAWAKNSAEPDQLERIAAFNIAGGLTRSTDRKLGWSYILAFAILDTSPNFIISELAEDFWADAVGEGRDWRLKCEEFLEGFVEGAQEVHRRVAKKP